MNKNELTNVTFYEIIEKLKIFRVPSHYDDVIINEASTYSEWMVK